MVRKKTEERSLLAGIAINCQTGKRDPSNRGDLRELHRTVEKTGMSALTAG